MHYVIILQGFCVLRQESRVKSQESRTLLGDDVNDVFTSKTKSWTRLKIVGDVFDMTLIIMNEKQNRNLETD